jgi:nucleoside-triphosphatase THEP1
VNTTINEKWKKASVIGSLWASLEILAGSFLHNIGFPLAGTILCMSSVVLMTAFLQVWPERGIIWRASLITALMKSISPSAIIIGPMTGILTEGLLMELGIMLFGANLVGSLAGGALAVFSTILHKIVSFLIIYGFDLLKLLENLYYFSVKQIGFQELSPWVLISVLSAFYILAGFLSAILGYRYGKRYLRTKNQTVINPFYAQKESAFFDIKQQKFSILLLILHIIFMLIIIYLINKQNLLVSVFAVFVYTIIVFLRYNNSLKHLKKFSFWAQALFITFIAAIFWNGYKMGDFFHPSGLIAGVKLNLRAIVILVSFSALSVELRNPFVSSLFYRRGFKPLYESIQLAFSAMPFVIENTPAIKEHFRKPFLLVQSMLGLSEVLYAHFMRKSPEIYLIIGEKWQGKTDFAVQLAKKFKVAGFSVGGFFSVAGNFENKVPQAYDLHFLSNAEGIPLCSVVEISEAPKIGKFYFNNSAVERGNSEICSSNANFLFVDEVGRLELLGNGWFSGISNIEPKVDQQIFWIVRKDFVSEIKKKFPQYTFIDVDIQKESPDEIMQFFLSKKSG